MQNCNVCNHLENKATQIAQTKYWEVALALDQGYLGRCYVTLREHTGSLADLTDSEWTDFAAVARKLERSVTKSFNALPSNWACMMNNAYQEAPANPHVHWHFRPRYDRQQTVNGTVFTDPLYGHHYDRDQRMPIDDKTFQIIRETLESAFSTEM